MGDEDIGDKIFGALSDVEKLENFERSTIKAVLGQLGWPSGRINTLMHDLGPAFTWEWFNDQAITGRTRIGSVRAFKYNFEELITKPHGHPISEAFREFKGDSQEPCCLVFKVHDHGRWVATNLTTNDDTSIRVVTDAGKLRFNVLPFTSFFSNRWEPRRE